MIYYTLKRSDSKYLANKDKWVDPKYKGLRHAFIEYSSAIHTAEFFNYFTGYDFEVYLEIDEVEIKVYETNV